MNSSCNQCNVPSGRMMPMPANNLYWQEDMSPTNVATIHTPISTYHYRGPFDNIPLGYSPGGLGYGGMYVPGGWGLWNYGAYRMFYPDIIKL